MRQKPGERPGFFVAETRETTPSMQIHRSFNMISRGSPRIIQSRMNNANPPQNTDRCSAFNRPVKAQR
jgi:hypothetical protein